MANERRKPEASGLRRLFHEQWTHFLRLADEWSVQRQEQREQAGKVASAIETVVEGTDARIRAIGSYKKRLRDSVRSVLEYVDSLVDALPAAVAVNQRAFTRDPLVNSFFVNQSDIQLVFSSSRELQAYFNAPEHSHLDEAYVLLFVTRQEKTVFGKSLQGDVMLSDVRQTSVNFSEHCLYSPCASEAMVRNALKTMLFNSIVGYVQGHMAHLRYRQFEESNNGKPISIDRNLRNPEVYLSELVNRLSAPRELLLHHEKSIRVSKMGIKVTEDEACSANELHLREVTVGNLPTHIVTIVKYPRAEMLPIDELIAKYGRKL